MPDTPLIDLLAVTDALIDLERLTARIARQEGVTIAIANGEPLLSESLTDIHARIVTACGLEDPGMKCDCLCHDVEPSGYRHGSHTPDLCVCFGTDFQGEQ